MFKYLAEMLSDQEFNNVTFNNVNKLLEQIYLTKSDEKANQSSKKTLRSFIYDSLNFSY